MLTNESRASFGDPHLLAALDPSWIRLYTLCWNLKPCTTTLATHPRHPPAALKSENPERRRPGNRLEC